MRRHYGSRRRGLKREVEARHGCETAHHMRRTGYLPREKRRYTAARVHRTPPPSARAAPLARGKGTGGLRSARLAQMADGGGGVEAGGGGTTCRVL